MIPLNYHHLYYFYVAATEGGITRAQDKLLLAQPTISAQISALEKSLGRPLFDRSSRRLALTEEGRFVLDYARRIFDLGTELLDALGDRPPEGRLRAQLGVVTGTPGAVVEALVAFLLEGHPKAHLTVREDDLDDLREGLESHRLDLLVSDRPAPPDAGPELISREAGRLPVVLAATPAAARKLGKLPQALDGAPMILPAQPSHVYRRLLDAFARHGVQPDIVAEVQDVELARRLALEGRGVVPLNRRTLRQGGGLVELPWRGLDVHEPVFLIARRRRWLNPLARRALDGFRL